MREVVYIAGPYGATGPEAETEIRRNVARALALGRLAAVEGFAPIVPHAIGFLGTYGTPDESDHGVRERAVESGEAHAAMVGALGGHLWIIYKDDATLSSGCRRELDAFVAGGFKTKDRGFGQERRCRGRTWGEWRDAFVTADLEEAWANPVAAFGLES